MPTGNVPAGCHPAAARSCAAIARFVASNLAASSPEKTCGGDLSSNRPPGRAAGASLGRSYWPPRTRSTNPEPQNWPSVTGVLKNLHFARWPIASVALSIQPASASLSAACAGGAGDRQRSPVPAFHAACRASQPSVAGMGGVAFFLGCAASRGGGGTCPVLSSPLVALL